MQTPRDENRITTLMGTLNTTGIAPVSILANPITHTLSISDGSSGSDNGPVQAPRDENRATTLLATSSVDGITPVVVYADSSGNLLTKST